MPEPLERHAVTGRAPFLAGEAGPEAQTIRTGDRLLSTGWEVYLLAIVGLIPIVTPSGPAQTAIVDAPNALALALFLVELLALRVAVQVPFVLPILVISTGSLLAMTNAVSLSASVLSVLQDAYLYAWFVLLVNLMIPRGDLRRVRLAWVWTADLVAAFGLVGSVLHGGGALLAAHGLRVAATFYNPNMFADYLMLSIFVVLSLSGQVRRLFLVPSLALLGLALLSTKSNGGLISTGAGLAAWAAVRARAAGVPAARVAGMALLALATIVIVVWAHAEWDLGGGLLRRAQEQSFLGRMSHSSESRQRIWQNLESDYSRSPLGIGPGNSTLQTVAIGDRERPDSFQSKGAHNDYLGYAVERGPLGLAGLLLLIAQAFTLVLRSRERLNRRMGGARPGGIVMASLLGVLVGTTFHSMVIEKLHFRHFWAIVAIVCAMTADDSGRRPAPAASPERRGAPTALRPRVVPALEESPLHA